MLFGRRDHSKGRRDKEGGGKERGRRGNRGGVRERGGLYRGGWKQWLVGREVFVEGFKSLAFVDVSGDGSDFGRSEPFLL